MHQPRTLSVSVVMLLALSAGVAMAQTGPQGAQVVRGDVQISRGADDRTVIRASDRAIINYRSFDIGSGELVQFVQPNANSRVLNRITGGEPTRIDGSIQANGRVYFVNRAGIAFGAGSVVDAGRFYAIAGNITDRDFVRGVDRFTLTGNVTNEGSISAKDGVVLAGQSVNNSGTITSVDASAVMVAGGQVLVREGDGRTYVSVGDVKQTKPAAKRLSLGGGDMLGNRLFENKSASSSVTSTGAVAARQVHVESTASTTVAGTIDTSNVNGAGGDVRVLGDTVRVAGNIDSRGTTQGGDVLIGGNWQGSGDERRATTSVVTSDASINTSGVNTGSAGTAVVWADGHTSFAGTMLAKGGDHGGDGAWVEVSGKNTLDYKGFVNASASKGESGTLLLDPKNIIIVDGASGTLSGTGFNDFSASTFSFDTDALTGVLNTGTGVVLQANNDITINEAITVNNASGTGGSLTLNALRSIVINQPIETDGGNVTFIANFGLGGVGTERDFGTGGISFGGSGSISAGTGIVTVQVNPSLGIFVPGGIVVGPVAASRLVLDGGVAISQSGDLNVGELLIRSAGPVTLTRTGNVIGKLAGDMFDMADIRGTGVLTIDEVGGTNVLRSTGAISLEFGLINQNHPIVTPSLTATARTGNIVLNNISNNVGSIDLRSRIGQSVGVGSGFISFNNNANLSVAGISTTGDVEVTAQGIMTQTGAIAADTLTLMSRSNGTITHTLLNATNTVRELSFSGLNAFGTTSGVANLNFAESNGLTLLDIDTSGSVRIATPGDVTQGVGTSVVAPGFAYASTNGSLTLTNTTNNFYNFAVSGLNANIFSTNTINVENVLGQPGVSMSGFARLISRNSVIQAEPVIADHLIVRSLSDGAAEINFALAGNDVNQLTMEGLSAAGTALGSQTIRFRDLDGFSILRLRTNGSVRLASEGVVNQVNANSGLVVGGSLALNSMNGQWSLTDSRNVVPILAGEGRSINLLNTGNISFGTGLDGVTGVALSGTDNFLRVISTGSISQTQQVAGDQLVLRVINDADSFITLDNASNQFSRVTLEARTNAGAAGAAPITYRDTDGFSLLRLTTASDALLSASGAVNQSGANQGIIASRLLLTGNNPSTWTLDRNDNSFAMLAGNTNGNLNLSNNRDLEIGTVSGVNGVAVGSESFLRMVVAGNITQTQAVSGDLLVARTLSDSFTQAWLANPANNFTSINMQSNNRANTSLGGGRLIYRDVNGFTVVGAQTNEQVILHADSVVNQLGATIPIIANGGMRFFGTGGYVFTRSDNRIPRIAGNTGTLQLTTNSDLIITQLGVASGLTTSANTTLSAFGTVTQDRPAVVTGTLTATTRTASGGGTVLLDQLGNRAGTLQLLGYGLSGTTGVASNLSFASSQGYAVQATRTTGLVTLTSNGVVTTPSGGSFVGASSLLLQGTGSFNLTSTENTFSTLAGNVGSVNVFTSGPLQIGQIDTTNGLVATGNVTLAAGGNISQSRQLRGLNLLATTLNNTGASIILTGPNNFFSGTRTLRTRNASGNADVEATATYLQ